MHYGSSQHRQPTFSCHQYEVWCQGPQIKCVTSQTVRRECRQDRCDGIGSYHGIMTTTFPKSLKSFIPQGLLSIIFTPIMLGMTAPNKTPIADNDVHVHAMRGKCLLLA